MHELGLNATPPDDVKYLFRFCEFLIAALDDEKSYKWPKIEKQRDTIFDNIVYILHETNHNMTKDAYGRTIIIEEKPEATLAAEIVEDTHDAYDILEYNHFALKGHLEEKRKILSALAFHIEQELKFSEFPECSKLKDNIKFLVNRFNIRHNITDDKHASSVIKSLTNDELEEWYDIAYQLIITFYVVDKYQEIKSSIEDIKKAIDS